MGYISLIGIILGVVIYIFLSAKGVSMIIGALIAATIIAITSGMNPMTAITGTFFAGFGNFMRSYFLIFALAAVFGKTMENSGSIRTIAVFLSSGLKKTKHSKYYAVLIMIAFYFILSYCGVSGYVTVFTVMAIARDLFEECDVPWILYPYGSAGTSLSLFVAGSLSSSNVIASNTFGTSLFSALKLSVICGAVFVLSLCLLLRHDLRRFEKRGEGFLPTGSAIKAVKTDIISDEDLPGVIVAFIPLFIPIASIIVFKGNVVISLLLAIIICFLLNIKKHLNFQKFNSAISQGIMLAAIPIISVCGAVGLTEVLKSAIGFELLLNSMDGFSPVFSGVSLGALTSLAVASSFSWYTSIGPQIMEKFMSAGMSAEVATRMVILSGFNFVMPHNAGVVNAITMAKYNFVQAAWIYWRNTAIPMGCALAVALILVSAGVFV